MKKRPIKGKIKSNEKINVSSENSIDLINRYTEIITIHKNHVITAKMIPWNNSSRIVPLYKILKQRINGVKM